MNKQASLLAAAARTAEVSGLKQDLQQTVGELFLVKRQLEESEGTKYPACVLMRDKWFLLIKAS